MSKILNNYWPLLGLFLGVSVAFNVIQWQGSKETKESLYEAENNLHELSNEYDSVLTVNAKLDSIIKEYEHVNDSLDSLILDNEDQINYLNNELEDALNEIDSITSDSSYRYLQKRYPTDTVKNYPFAGNQVKSIHKDVTFTDYLDSIRVEQAKTIDYQAHQIDLKDELIEYLRKNKTEQEALIDDLYKRLSKAQLNYDLAEAETRRLKKLLTAWKIGSISTGAVLAGLIILL